MIQFLKKHSIVLLSPFIGVAVGLGVGRLDIFGKESVVDLNGWSVVVFLLLLLLVLLVHELGHLLTGLWQGNKFILLVIGFLGIKRTEEDTIRPYFNTDWSYFGGVAASSPATYQENSAQKFANVVIAGPLTSLGLGLGAGVVAYFLPQPYAFYSAFVSFSSFLIALATLYPSHSGSFYSDGKRYLRLTRPGSAQQIELALSQASQLVMTKQPLTSMSLKELQGITQDASPTFQAFGHYYLYLYHKGAPEAQQAAREAIEELKPTIPKTTYLFIESAMKEQDA